MSSIRLDKYLADAGLGTRSQVKEYIKKNKVVVNGVTVRKPDIKIQTDKDEVLVEGKLVSYAEFEYYMLHKPAGVVSATKDDKDKTVIELIKEDKRRDIFPVGRLDKDTEGLILITNDGVLANSIIAPGKHVDKTYFARVSGKVTEDVVTRFKEGIDIGDDTLTKPAKLSIINIEEIETGFISEVEIIITEGRYHQIKRMFKACDMEVKYLKRISMGSLILDEKLGCGE
ncbi:MAG: rRNA pseudouridine synthase, partial [Lachnospiraceae bacterium]|nr:rRNA pseudouridine synthase [Lachnospiraceae bacterium]